VVITHHLSAPAPAVSERRPELAEFDAVITRAMAKDPGERYATCSDFASALAGNPVAAPMSGATHVIAAPQPAKTSGRRLRPALLLAALVAVVAITLAVVVGIRALSSRDNERAGGPPTSSGASPSAATSRSNSGSPGSHPAPASAPMTLSNQITDQSNALKPQQRADVSENLATLQRTHRTKLWVVYVKNFDRDPARWADMTLAATHWGDGNAILAVATDSRTFSLHAPGPLFRGKVRDLDVIRRERIQPKVDHGDWAAAAIEAVNALADMPA
jgi:hypothetical protein